MVEILKLIKVNYFYQKFGYFKYFVGNAPIMNQEFKYKKLTNLNV